MQNHKTLLGIIGTGALLFTALSMESCDAEMHLNKLKLDNLLQHEVNQRG